MRAAIIAVGSELLGTSRLDTNSLLLTTKLEEYGVAVTRKAVVGDVRESIAEELEFALASNDVVLITGGLGPTADDLTKEAVAEAVGLQLEMSPEVLAQIESLFAKRNTRMPEVNRKQAAVFANHRYLVNQSGSAPGFHLNIHWQSHQRHIWIFPGVPAELDGMIEHDLEPWLRQVTPGSSLHRRVVKLVGLTESAVEESLRPFYDAHPDEPLTILASQGEIQLHLQVHGEPDEAYPRLTALEQAVRQIFGDSAYGLDADDLPSVIGRMLAARGESVAVAESCTGGLLASRITDVSGSSAYFMGGIVTYSRDAKLFLLGVDPAMIDAHGEVSEEVSRDMARGARRRFGTTYGIAITGIAGPTGGTEAKPVGTVHVAVSSRTSIDHKRLQLPGRREAVKLRSTQAALDLLRVMMLRN